MQLLTSATPWRKTYDCSLSRHDKSEPPGCLDILQRQPKPPSLLDLHPPTHPSTQHSLHTRCTAKTGHAEVCATTHVYYTQTRRGGSAVGWFICWYLTTSRSISPCSHLVCYKSVLFFKGGKQQVARKQTCAPAHKSHAKAHVRTRSTMSVVIDTDAKWNDADVEQVSAVDTHTHTNARAHTFTHTHTHSHSHT